MEKKTLNILTTTFKKAEASLARSWNPGSVFAAIIFLLASLVLNYFAGSYATKNASNPVNDLILDNLPIVDVSIAFVYGFSAFCIFALALAARNLQKLPFAFKTIALFVIIRSIFISLTHVAPIPDAEINYTYFLFNKIVFNGDLFFSAHVGLPFLAALLYWNNKKLRIFFLASSFFFGFIVLLGHLHYSIDVFAAFFITYGIFRLAQYFFKKDYKSFVGSAKI
ncbi:sphingomyelin synthase family protein [Patescibacteria group bacterium]|nr:sphingomyelin synthase family protein [Patescibacteria group bacterium]